MKQKFARLLPFVGVLLPTMAFAQTGATFGTVIGTIGDIVDLIVPILVTAALAYFVWGVISYVKASPEEKKKSRDIIIHGIIGLFAIVSVWGLVKLIQSTFDIEGGAGDVEDIVPIIQ